MMHRGGVRSASAVVLQPLVGGAAPTDMFGSAPYGGFASSAEAVQNVRYGEVIARGLEMNRWTVLSVTQFLLLLYFVAFLVVFVLEIQSAVATALWQLAIWFVALGGALILIEMVAYIFYRRASNIVDPPYDTAAGSQAPSLTYLGKSHLREVFLGILASLLGYAFLTWLQLDFLFRFKNDGAEGEGCCANSAANRPDPTVAVEWRVFNSCYTLMAALAFATAWFMLRAVIVHLRPAHAVTQIYTQLAPSARRR